MNKNLIEIIEYIKSKRSELTGFVENLSRSDYEKKPSMESWSSGGVMLHLYKTEMFIKDLLIRQLERAEKKNLGPDTENIPYLHSLDKFEVEIVNQKFNAPEQTHPGELKGQKEIIKMMEDSRNGLLDVLNAFGKYDMGKIELPHPAYGRMNMYQWIVFLGKHEERHFNQIKMIFNS